MKRKYEKPKMEVVKIQPSIPILSCSGNDDAYWNGCHEGWKGGWGENED